MTIPSEPALLPCPWDSAEPERISYVAKNQGLKSACAFVTCPVCGVQKGFIAEPGDEDLSAAIMRADRRWNDRTPAQPVPPTEKETT